MKIYFSLPEFDGQLLRTLTYIPSGGADLGECMTTAARIKEGDFESWYNEWVNTASRIADEAEESLSGGHLISACKGFLRASNYYRTAYYFLTATPLDPRVETAYDKHVETFEKAVRLLPYPVEAMTIPYCDTPLTGYFYKASKDDVPRQTIITFTGYDGTQQETYFSIAKAGLERGFNVFCFDGPGQGQALIKNKLIMTPEWNLVVTPVIDHLIKRNDVDSSALVLVGQSWGGMLAPLAASEEHRLAALVVSPGQYDALQSIKKALPQVEELIKTDNYAVLDQILSTILADKMVAAKFKSKMWVHGVDTAFELLKEWTRYSLDGKAEKISCPTLIIDCENEPFSAGQAKQLYDALRCPKEYIMCKNAVGAGEHCGAGALTIINQRIYDWIETTLKHSCCPQP